MNEIKKCIDNELRNIKLSPDFITRITEQEKPQAQIRQPIRKMNYSAATVLLCILLLGTSALAAGSLLYSRISVNQQQIPDLEPMEIIPLQPVDGTKRTFSSMEELENELGIKLLGSNLAAENPYIKIFYTKTGDGYNAIDIQEYLTGDLANIREWNGENNTSTTEGNDEWYAWTQGNIYKSPIDLNIVILSDPSQPELDTEYMGYFQYVETFTADQGYTVNVLQDTVDEDQLTNMPEDFIPQTRMVFVAGGIQYTLQGHVPIEIMKEVIDSMK